MAQDFHPGQRELLLRTLDQYEPRALHNPLANPVSMVYLVARAWNRSIDEACIDLGACCSLYLLALDLIDDVQDGDLAHKPHQQAGPAIAINSGLTLLFLALDRLRCSFDRAGPAESAWQRLELLNRASLSAVTGQHRDLIGLAGARTPDEVLAMQQAKTSSLVLLLECGALLAGLDEPLRARYRRVGENLARLVQVVDDLRDIYGKPLSPDLASGRVTYPLAWFFELAGAGSRQRFESLRALLPDSQPEIRRLFYELGVVRRCAGALERFRTEIHREIAATGNTSAAHRTLLDTVDQQVTGIYAPRRLAETASFWTPEGAWHAHVEALGREFSARMRCYHPPELPAFVPWHQPQWMYEARNGVVFYPDLEEQAGEVVPFQAALLGTDDHDGVAQVMRAQAPAVMAHELFHRWRHRRGRLTGAHWHEEYAANRLAVAYCREFEPSALATALELATRVLQRFPPTERTDDVLRSAAEASRAGSGYRMNLEEMAVTQLEMVRRLSSEPLDLAQEVERWLAPPGTAEAAA